MFSDYTSSIGSMGVESFAGPSDEPPVRPVYYPYPGHFEEPAPINYGANQLRFNSVDGRMSSYSRQHPSNAPSNHYEREVSTIDYNESYSEEHSSSGSEVESPVQTYKAHAEAESAIKYGRQPAPQSGPETSHYMLKGQHLKMSETPAKMSLEFKFAPRTAVEKVAVQQVAHSEPHFHSHPHHYYPAQMEVSESEPSRSNSAPERAPDPVYGYPDLTTMVNSSEQAVGPMVEVEFVDSKVCTICRKRITRDMLRHMRTHEKKKRFVCVFSDDACGHRSNQFNRRYDFTKHLLNKHFIYDIPEVVKTSALKDKLFHWGTCGCGQRFLAQNWLEHHVLTRDEGMRCSLLSGPQGYWPE